MFYFIWEDFPDFIYIYSNVTNITFAIFAIIYVMIYSVNIDVLTVIKYITIPSIFVIRLD